jgi:hypothetical protein
MITFTIIIIIIIIVNVIIVITIIYFKLAIKGIKSKLFYTWLQKTTQLRNKERLEQQQRILSNKFDIYKSQRESELEKLIELEHQQVFIAQSRYNTIERELESLKSQFDEVLLSLLILLS